MADTRKLAAWAAGPATFERHLREAGMALSDEEYGRAWAAMMGVEVRKADDTLLGSKWWRIRDGRLPTWFLVNLFHLSAGDAYAALGAAVRAVHKAVPPLTGG